MCSFPERMQAAVAALVLVLVLALALALAGAVQAQPTAYPHIGRAATPQEVAAWDIDVRPDLKGLPAGAGSVAQGMQVWEAKCASCHGIFGESHRPLFVCPSLLFVT